MGSLPVRILPLVLLAVLTLAALACGGDKEPAAPTPAQAPAAAPADAAQAKLTAIPSDLPPFVIGVMESVTGPGETYGTVAVQAKQMAADEINAGGGESTGADWSSSSRTPSAAPKTRSPPTKS